MKQNGQTGELTSLGNTDDCVRGLLCYGDGFVRDFSQQIHQITEAVVNHPPIPGEAPGKEGK